MINYTFVIENRHFLSPTHLLLRPDPEGSNAETSIAHKVIPRYSGGLLVVIGLTSKFHLFWIELDARDMSRPRFSAPFGCAWRPLAAELAVLPVQWRGVDIRLGRETCTGIM
jgi:hypothetical protein